MKRALDWAGYAGLAALAVLALLRWTRSAWLTGTAGTWLWWGLLVVGVALVLASLVVHVGSLRGVMKTRSARYGLNTAVMVLLLLGIIGLVEAVSYRHNWRTDLTQNKRFSLAPQTIDLLRRTSRRT